MRYRRSANQSERTFTLKYGAKCHCCGGYLPAGETATWYPKLHAFAHFGGLEGNSPRCTSEIRSRLNRDPGYVDLDRAYEDQCADVCGR